MGEPPLDGPNNPSRTRLQFGCAAARYASPASISVLYVTVDSKHAQIYSRQYENAGQEARQGISWRLV